jgi:hypothetical protein
LKDAVTKKGREEISEVERQAHMFTYQNTVREREEDRLAAARLQAELK